MSKKKEDIKEFLKDDVIIIESLKVTKARHGINTHMTKMIGNEYIVDLVEMHHSGHPIVRVRDDNDSRWVFAPSDLTLVQKCSDVISEAMPGKPIMFDPNELV